MRDRDLLPCMCVCVAVYYLYHVYVCMCIYSSFVIRYPGFLRTRPGSDKVNESGGNLALRDLVAALRWVQENIAAFGGDPTRVTLMGHDTGAALANLLLISPVAKGND